VKDQHYRYRARARLLVANDGHCSGAVADLYRLLRDADLRRCTHETSVLENAGREGNLPCISAAAPPTQQGLRNFLKAALTVYLRDDAFAAAITDPNPVTTDSQHLRDRLQDGLHDLLARTAAADGMHPDLTVADVMLLLCGIGFAIRHAPDHDDPGLPDRYLSALLNGVLNRHDR
jgi:hypothetical protein